MHAENVVDGNAAATSPQALEFFEQHVRPVLVLHCQECHGAKKQEGDLRLDSRESLLKGGLNGPVVVPNSPTESRLITAIGYADDNLQMPPDEPLPSEAVKTLTEWVRLGAPWPVDDAIQNSKLSSADSWKRHWAAQPVRGPSLPPVQQADWPRSPVDHFVLSKLEQNGLTPSPPADRRTLLRRATFDLIGLPPTLEELAAFEQDMSPDAFAKVVDRLLASPRYGERWGRHWLDVARYADTKEYVRLSEERRYLYAFTYRDYVIRAFNEDLPYDQFVTEQLAADLLPVSDQPRPLAALGFLTLGRQFTGNPHDIIDDRIDVTTRGLLGLSVTCARCHDHKYDPIPTADYYSLYGVFANTEVPAVPTLLDESPTDPQQQAHLSAARAREAALKDYHDRAHKALLHEIRSMVGAYLVEALEGRRPYLVPLPPAPGEVRHFVSERWLDAVDAAGRDAVPAFLPWQALAAIKSDQNFTQRSREILAQLHEQNGSDPAAPRPNSLVMQALEAQPLTSMIDVARAYGKLLEDIYLRHSAEEPSRQNLVANGSFELEGPVANVAPAGWQLEGTRFVTLDTEGAADGLLAAVFGNGTSQSSPPTAHSASLSQTVPTRAQTRYRLSFNYGVFGSNTEAAAQSLKVTAAGNSPLVEHDLTSHGSDPAVFQETVLEFVADRSSTTITFSDVTANNESGAADGVLDNVVLTELGTDHPLSSPLSTGEAELLELVSGATSFTSITPNEAVDQYLYDGSTHNTIMGLRICLNTWLAATDTAPRRAHTMVDRTVPLDPCVLVRGNPSRHGAHVPRKFLRALAGDEPKPFGRGSGRLDLARAIVSPDNLLTSRVLVNRVWLHHFGSGLVRSPSNFGLRGDAPTHPDLVDFLADRFMAEGWSIKRLHRLIMLSSTYQQASADREDAYAKDPANRLLWKVNRQRLDFEALRDAMLMTAGRLDLAVGGPGVNLADSNSNRRTVYGYIDRANLPGVLGTFDFATPESHTPERHTTTVPQQALFLMNSPFVLQQATAFATRADVQSLVDVVQRITRMHSLALGRNPNGEELQALRAFIDSGGSWPQLAQVLLLSNEFSFVD